MPTADSAQDDAAGCGPTCSSRRSVLAAVGAAGVAAALTGCQAYGAESAPPPATGAPAGGGSLPAGEPSATDPAAQESAAQEPAGGEEPAAGSGGEVLASLSDIPVGGGVVFADKGVVVTCPKEGTVKAFSATCPHAGCAVNQVTRGTINCPCHGSRFRVADGSVAAGPAAEPLSSVGVTVDGNSIKLT